jgi:hypothetical protein
MPLAAQAIAKTSRSLAADRAIAFVREIHYISDITSGYALE